VRPLGYVVLLSDGVSTVTEPKHKQPSTKFIFPLPQSQLDDLRAVSRRTKTPVARLIRRALDRELKTDVELAPLVRVIASDPTIALAWVALMEQVESDQSRSPAEKELARTYARIVTAGQDRCQAQRRSCGRLPAVELPTLETNPPKFLRWL
jgi:hypothetical protein